MRRLLILFLFCLFSATLGAEEEVTITSKDGRSIRGKIGGVRPEGFEFTRAGETEPVVIRPEMVNEESFLLLSERALFEKKTNDRLGFVSWSLKKKIASEGGEFEWNVTGLPLRRGGWDFYISIVQRRISEEGAEIGGAGERLKWSMDGKPFFPVEAGVFWRGASSEEGTLFSQSFTVEEIESLSKAKEVTARVDFKVVKVPEVIPAHLSILSNLLIIKERRAAAEKGKASDDGSAKEE